MPSQVQMLCFTSPSPWSLSSDHQTNTTLKSKSSTLSPYTVTITYCRDEPRWLDSTQYHTMPSPRDIVTITGKAELHLGAEEYTATLTTEAASGAFQSNLDSTAKLPDTDKGVRTTSRHDSSARAGFNQALRHKLGRATPRGSTAPRHTNVSKHFSLQDRFCAEQDWRRGISSDEQGGNT